MQEVNLVCSLDPKHLSNDWEYCDECGGKMEDLSDGQNVDGQVDHAQEISAQLNVCPESSSSLNRGSALRCPDCDSSVLPQDKFCDCCRCDLTQVAPVPNSNVPSSPPNNIVIPLQDSENLVLSEESSGDDVSIDGVTSENELFMTDDVLNERQDVEQDEVLKKAVDQPLVQEVSIEGTDLAAGEDDLFSNFGTVQEGTSEELKGPMIPVSTLSVLVWEVVVEADVSLCKDPESFADFPKDLPKKIFVLEKPVSVVGRAHTKSTEQPDVVVREDKCVSRSHLKLYIYPDGGLFVLDETSSNGSMLNGVVLDHGARTELEQGDVLTIGNWTKLTVRKSPVFQ